MSVEGNLVSKEGVRQVVRVILITCDGYMVIGKRALGEREGGKWCLVGGMAEGDELSRECLREIEEEIGVSTGGLTDEKVPTYAFSVDRMNSGQVWRNNYFILEIDDPAVPTILEKFNREEFSEIAVVNSVDDIKGLRFAFGDGKIVRDFFRHVGN